MRTVFLAHSFLLDSESACRIQLFALSSRDQSIYAVNTKEREKKYTKEETMLVHTSQHETETSQPPKRRRNEKALEFRGPRDIQIEQEVRTEPRGPSEVVAHADSPLHVCSQSSSVRKLF